MAENWRVADLGQKGRALDKYQRAVRELLIDCEQDRTVRAVLVGMLREGDGAR